MKHRRSNIISKNPRCTLEYSHQIILESITNHYRFVYLQIPVIQMFGQTLYPLPFLATLRGHILSTVICIADTTIGH